MITGAAREPEVTALMEMLNAMGARVTGAGTDTLCVEGVPAEQLTGCTVEVIGDRIVAGTYLMAAAMTGGEAEVTGFAPKDLGPLCDMLAASGCRLSVGADRVALAAPARLKAIGTVETRPFPGFATDLQAPWFALCTVAEGESRIEERIFECRFHHAAELARMGAQIELRERCAVIRGVERLTGTRVWARDLRGGAALVLASLAAQGTGTVENIHFIDRGYESLDRALRALGARVERQLRG